MNPFDRVNSKATLKVPLATLFPLVPRLLHSPLRASRYATDRSQALVIQSDESRQQATNVDLCYEKLNRLLVSSAKEIIPGETSQEQRDRVSKLYRPTAPLFFFFSLPKIRGIAHSSPW